MSNNAPESRGQFVTPKVTRPPIVVDCSKWVDTSDGTWTFGNFVTPKATREPIIVDCSTWNRDSAVWLELVVSFDADTKPLEVVKHTDALVAAASAAVPDLGLTYDSDRTRAEGDSVVLSLKPRDAAGAAERLAEAADVIRKATATVAADVRVRVSGQAA